MGLIELLASALIVGVLALFIADGLEDRGEGTRG